MEILKCIGRWLVAGLLLSTGLTVQAAPLNLVLGLPDITANYISTNYDADSDVFTADGFAASITYDGITQTPMSSEAFSLSATISAGGVLGSGTFSIGTWISGDLTDFGFDNGSSLLEFKFDPTAGSLMSFYDASPSGGIILAFSGYNDTENYIGNDNFNSNFASVPFGAVADIAPVPVPAALWLFGSGLLGLVGIARRRG